MNAFLQIEKVQFRFIYGPFILEKGIKFLLRVFLIFGAFGAASAQDKLNFEWNWGATNGEVNVEDVAFVPADSGYIVVGNFKGFVSFHPSNASFNGTSITYRRAFIIRLNKNKNPMWMRTYHHANAYSLSSGLRAVRLDNQGNITVCGYFSGSIDLDPTSGLNIVNSADTLGGYADGFVVRYNSAGDFKWCNIFRAYQPAGATNFDAFNIAGMDVDPVSGKSFFIGVAPIKQEVVLVGSDSQYFYAGYNRPKYALSLDSSGHLLNHRNWYSHYLNGNVTNIKYVSGNRILVVANFTNSILIDSANNTSYSGNGWRNELLTYFDTGLVHIKSVVIQAQTNGSVETKAVVQDQEGNLYFSGSMRVGADFDPGNGNYVLGAQAGQYAGFIYSLDSSLAFRWAGSWAHPVYGNWVNDLEISPDGRQLLVANEFKTSMDADTDPNQTDSVTNTMAWYGSFVCHLDTSGDYLGHQVLESPNASKIHSIKSLGSDEYFLFLQTYDSGDINLGSGNHWHVGNPISNSSYKSVLAGYRLRAPVQTTEVLSECAPFTWRNGKTYHSGNSTDWVSMPSYYGADSIIKLDLTILNDFVVDSVFACDEYTWINNRTYYQSTVIPVKRLTNRYGCDSLVQLILDLKQGSYNRDTVSVCDSFDWSNGQTYFSSTIDTNFITLNDQGCDSSNILYLTIFPSFTQVDSVTACDSFQWIDGFTYDQSNHVASLKLKSQFGCDSNYYLHLDIKSSQSTFDQQQACDSFTWQNGKTYYQSASGISDTLQTFQGCDSILTLDLTINNSVFQIDSITACDSYTWVNGITYTQNTTGVYQYKSTSSGCDSIIELKLNVNSSYYDQNSIQACNQYTWINGKTYSQHTQDTIYSTTITGCDSIHVLDLNLTVIEDSVIRLGSNGLIAMDSLADSYQWLDCQNWSTVSGADSAYFFPTVNGFYAVQVSKDQCIDTSSCLMVSGVFITQELEKGILIYPNPSDGGLHISAKQPFHTVEVVDLAGRVVQRLSYAMTRDAELELKLAAGVYQIHVIGEFGRTIEQLIIQ